MHSRRNDIKAMGHLLRHDPNNRTTQNFLLPTGEETPFGEPANSLFQHITQTPDDGPTLENQLPLVKPKPVPRREKRNNGLSKGARDYLMHKLQ